MCWRILLVFCCYPYLHDDFFCFLLTVTYPGCQRVFLLSAAKLSGEASIVAWRARKKISGGGSYEPHFLEYRF